MLVEWHFTIENNIGSVLCYLIIDVWTHEATCILRSCINYSPHSPKPNRSTESDFITSQIDRMFSASRTRWCELVWFRFLLFHGYQPWNGRWLLLDWLIRIFQFTSACFLLEMKVKTNVREENRRQIHEALKWGKNTRKVNERLNAHTEKKEDKANTRKSDRAIDFLFLLSESRYSHRRHLSGHP